jgi:hypothetical protein
VQRVGGEFLDVVLTRTLVTTLCGHFQYVHVDRDESFVALDMQLPTTLELARLRTLAPDVSRQTGFYRSEDFAPFLLKDDEQSRALAEVAAMTCDCRGLRTRTLEVDSARAGRRAGNWAL